MTNIADNITQVMQRIQLNRNNLSKFDLNPTLLAVSKGQPASAIETAYACGLRDFGENYLQEALQKTDQLRQKTDISWHFIGPLQSNKTRHIAENFHWLHTVDRLKIAERLSAQRPDNLPPLNICLQVNIDNDPNKSGATPEQTEDLALAVAQLPNLKLRGLMTIPARQNGHDPKQPFRALRELLEQLKARHPELKNMDTLSMGMSNDLEAAIAEGATIIRVGTDIFGPRLQKNNPAH